MRIIISPAKKMRVDTDSLPYTGLPVYLDKTMELYHVLKGKSYDELKKLWKCNDEIAALNVRRLDDMDLQKNLTPAIVSYEGIQYRYMAPHVFTERELAYVQEHLRILSGFYGILKPFDGVTPYRLEMQAKLQVGRHRNLYGFWGDLPARTLLEETDCVINLASQEYSTVISERIPDSVKYITCVFGEEKDGKVIEKGTMCKMARGEMVRFMAQNEITIPEQIKSFDHLNYRFSERYSGDDLYVFLTEQTGG